MQRKRWFEAKAQDRHNASQSGDRTGARAVDVRLTMEQDMRKTWMGLLAAAVMMTGVNLSAQSSKPVSFGIAGGGRDSFR